MISKHWELIRAIHSEKTGIPPHIVDCIAIYEILSKCVRGLSNKTISKLFDFKIQYVEVVLKEYLNFDGWRKNLAISPYHIYRASLTSPNKFSKALQVMSNLSIQEIKMSYEICFKFEKISKEIEKYEYTT